jgi:hypothetical protein
MPRPAFNPTEEDRRLVKTLAGLGMPHEQIALRLAIRSAKTLRKHFRQELDTGAAEATAQVAQSLYKMAIGGEVAAAIFWMKARGGWTDRPMAEARPDAPPPFIVAREETP